MSKTSVSITWHDSAFRELNSDAGVVGNAVRKAAGSLRDDAKLAVKNAGRTSTGALMQSMYSERSGGVNLSGVTYDVGSNQEYAYWQHEGVRGPIYPRRAKMLRFKPKGATAFIFRPMVSGFSGIHFLTEPLAKLSVSDFM